MQKPKGLISVVVPLYYEQEVLKTSFEAMDKVMKNSLYDYELIYVDDGSQDRTWEILQRIAKDNPQVKGFKLSRNFGHQLAVSAGMKQAKGDAIIIIDADLQDPPEVMLEMIKKWEEGYEVVYGKRLKRKGENFLKKFTAFLYYRLLKALSAYDIPLDTGDFRLIDSRVCDTLTEMKEHNRFLRGMGAWTGFNQCAVEYVRNERYAGQTKYTFKKMINLALSGILGFSYKPLLLPFNFGIFLMIASLISIIVSLITGFASAVGFGFWAFEIILFLMGIVFITFGIFGAYLSRIMEEALDRPLYIISKAVNAKIEK